MALTKNAEKTLDEVGSRCADLAMRAAIEVVSNAGVELRGWADEKIESFCEFIRQETKDAISGALEDGRAAVSCGMAEVGAATFAASFRLAGIKAGKRWLAAQGVRS